MGFQKQYDKLLEDIITNGISNEGEEVRTVWKDGRPAYTKALWVRQFRIKPTDIFPLLRKKYVNPKSLVAEILWIMQKASNVVSDARELGTSVWDEWENEEGTIGKAYGYQIRNNTYKVNYDDISVGAILATGKTFGFKDTETSENYEIHEEVDGRYVYLNQIDYVIYKLIDDPSSRQTITTLMNPKEFNEMELPPCVWASHWNVIGGKLHLSVTSRSSDTFLGLPFNIAQYAMLHRLIAHVTGHELGEFVFTGDNVHLYDRHIPKAIEFLNREEAEVTPEMWIDEDVKMFQEFEYGVNFGFKGYSKDKVKPLKAPIAIGKREYERLKKENKRNKE